MACRLWDGVRFISHRRFWFFAISSRTNGTRAYEPGLCALTCFLCAPVSSRKAMSSLVDPLAGCPYPCRMISFGCHCDVSLCLQYRIPALLMSHSFSGRPTAQAEEKIVLRVAQRSDETATFIGIAAGSNRASALAHTASLWGRRLDAANEQSGRTG